MIRLDQKQRVNFEIFVMDLCEECKCEIAEDFEDMAEDLHICVENAIQDMCLDLSIEDYNPCY